MQHYAARLKSGIKVERPIAFGVLKIKAKLGELMPGEKGGRGNKKPNGQTVDFNPSTVSCYRKIASNVDKLEGYFEATDDVPTQTDFLKYIAEGGIIATKHGSGVVDWYTPVLYVDAAREVMGEIDLDPASSTYAQKTVKAKKHYTAATNGLDKDWSGRVFLNPPYKMPDVASFVNKLCDEYDAGDVARLISFLVPS